MNFSLWAFSTNFCSIWTGLSGNTVWQYPLVFQKFAKIDHFWWTFVKWDFLRYFVPLFKTIGFGSHWFYMTSDLWCKSSSCDHWDVFSRSLGRDLENPSSFQFGVPFFLDLAHAWMLLWNRCCCSIMMMMAAAAAAVKLQCCLQRKQLDKVWFSTIKMVWVPWSSIFQRDLALQRCWFYQCFPNLFSTPMLNKPVDSPISRYPQRT